MAQEILTRFHDGAGKPSDIDLIGELSNNMLGRTFCASGGCGSDADDGFITKFRDEFEAYLKNRLRRRHAGTGRWFETYYLWLIPSISQSTASSWKLHRAPC